MDIEERAERWARDHIADKRIKGLGVPEVVLPALIAAYLAGVAQTQADYVTHYVTQCERITACETS